MSPYVGATICRGAAARSIGGARISLDDDTCAGSRATPYLQCAHAGPE